MNSLRDLFKSQTYRELRLQPQIFKSSLRAVDLLLDTSLLYITWTGLMNEASLSAHYNGSNEI